MKTDTRSSLYRSEIRPCHSGHALPLPASRAALALLLCPALALLPVTLSLAASAKPRATRGKSAADSTPATFELARTTYRHATLSIREGDLVIQHDGGATRHPLVKMYYKTLLRIGQAKPALRDEPAYRAALATFLPELAIAGRNYRGVRIEGQGADTVTFLTDDGEISRPRSELSPETNLALTLTSATQLAAQVARVEQQRRAREAQAAAARQAAEQAAARERARQAAIARYRAAWPDPSPSARASSADDDFWTAVGLGAVVVAGAWAWDRVVGNGGGDDSSADEARAIQQQRDLEFSIRQSRQREEERFEREKQAEQQREQMRIEKQNEEMWERARAQRGF